MNAILLKIICLHDGGHPTGADVQGVLVAMIDCKIRNLRSIHDHVDVVFPRQAAVNEKSENAHNAIYLLDRFTTHLQIKVHGFVSLFARGLMHYEVHLLRRYKNQLFLSSIARFSTASNSGPHGTVPSETIVVSSA